MGRAHAHFVGEAFPFPLLALTHRRPNITRNRRRTEGNGTIMASSQPIWAGGGGGFGATELGSGEPPVETLLVGQTRCVVRECVGW